MAEGILGLGQGQAASLNSDMLEKLKAVDRKATVEPIEKKLEKFESEKKVISDVTTKVNELFDAVKVFSLNQSTGTNAFQQKSANVSGDGVVFDSDDLSALKTGSMRVKVEKLAQKDVWQSNPISGLKTDTVNAGIITINGINIDTSTMSYTKLTEEINKISGVQASLVDSSDGKFRLAIKSTETGTANKINFDSSSGKISDGTAKLFGKIAQKDEWQTAINDSKDQIEDAGKITINGKEYDCKFKLPERSDTSKSITTRDLDPIPYWLVEDVTEDYKSDVTDLFGINATSLKIERIYIGSFTPLR